MSKQLLKSHAVTCIKNAIVDCIRGSEHAGVAYSVHCDREHCWDVYDLVSDYYCALNVKEDGYTLGQSLNRVLSDGSSVKAKEATLNFQFEVYANGCSATIDTAFSVIADVAATVHKEQSCEMYCKRIEEVSTARIVNVDYSEEKTRLVQLMRAEFDYVPTRPSLIFSRYSRGNFK